MYARFVLSLMSIVLMLQLYGCLGTAYIGMAATQKVNETFFSDHIAYIYDAVKIQVTVHKNGVNTQRLYIRDPARIREILAFINAHRTGWIEQDHLRYIKLFQGPLPPSHIDILLVENESGWPTRGIAFCVEEKRMEAMSMAYRAAYRELSLSETNNLTDLLLTPGK